MQEKKAQFGGASVACRRRIGGIGNDPVAFRGAAFHTTRAANNEYVRLDEQGRTRKEGDSYENT
jgi:hypothetical protein